MVIPHYSFSYLVFLAIVVSRCYSSNQGENSIFAVSNRHFAAGIYGAVNNDENESILLSPFSINYALTALSYGLGGSTLAKLRTALDQRNDEKAIGSSYKSFTDSLKGSENLKIATNVYLDNKFKVKDEFKKKVSHDLEAGFENVNFAGDAEGSRQTINLFVDNRTNHLIPELIKKGLVSEVTNAVIVNALYFKSTWLTPFDKKNTQKKKFYGSQAEYEVEMMQDQSGLYSYLDDKVLNAQIVEIPYKEDKHSFVIILPNERQGLADVEKKLNLKGHDSDSSQLEKILKLKNNQTIVDLYFPKFTFDHSYYLKPNLEKMGLEELFSSAGDFSRLSDQKIAIDDVVHQTHITVDESGTEAAAATAVIMAMSIGPGETEPKQFNADHPFIYIIKDKATETALFIGRYTKP